MTPLSDEALSHLELLLAETAGSDRYRLGGEIGRGGMGIVYLAEDTVLKRHVALKILSHPTTDLEHRLTREARILAALEHPGVVPVHDAGLLPDGRLFYAMKHVNGQRLDEWSQSAHSLADRLRLFLRICEPVAFAHARNIVHRDLKPENIMIGSFGEVLVLDWGVAKLLDSASEKDGELASNGAGTVQGIVIGTPGYMAPEQSQGSSVDQRADIYALGRILQSLDPEAPKRVAAIAARATQQDPELRYQTVLDLAADISNYLDGLPMSAYRESLWEIAARLLSKHQTLVAIIGAYLLMRVALFLWFRR